MLGIQQRKILEILAQRETETYVADIILASKRILNRDTIFGELNFLEERGYVNSRIQPEDALAVPEGPDDVPMFLYKITEAGRKALEQA
jgi:DNA-binding PadR family transcriptional regulator